MDLSKRWNRYKDFNEKYMDKEGIAGLLVLTLHSKNQKRKRKRKQKEKTKKISAPIILAEANNTRSKTNMIKKKKTKTNIYSKLSPTWLTSFINLVCSEKFQVT